MRYAVLVVVEIINKDTTPRSEMKRICVEYVVILFFIQCCFPVPLQASILAKSSINQCTTSSDVKTKSGKLCSKMLVVALTVTEDEV